MFKDMTDAELAEAYKAWRGAAYDWSRMSQGASPRSRSGRRIAAGWGRAMRNVEIIEAIARKRGARLV